MEKQEMIKEILAYEKELKFNYEECKNAFGHLDNDTQRAWREWNTINELLTRLNLQNEII